MKTIILDNDIGTNPDDFFSLLMLLNSNNINLPLVISGNNYPFLRARLAKKIIDQNGREGVVVVSGEPAGHIDFHAQEFIEGYESEINSDYKSEIKKVLDNHGELFTSAFRVYQI